MRRVRASRTKLCWLAVFIVSLSICSAVSAAPDIPKGYVDPVKELGMGVDNDDDRREFWRRAEEIYLEPFEVSVVMFDAIIGEYGDTGFHPISGAPLIIKRGQVVPSYQIDLEYGPVTGRNDEICKLEGLYIMKNIQFGSRTFQGILYNIGGSVDMSWQRPSSDSASTLGYVFTESMEYGSQNRLPEASYAGSARVIEEYPDTLLITVNGSELGKQSGGQWNTAVLRLRFRVVGAKFSPPGANLDGDDESLDAVVRTDAAKNRGETAVPIAGALAATIIGGAAAAVGAGTDPDGGDDDKKKKSSYQMRLKKDFGDTIRYNKAPVPIYARMVEITADGQEIDRPDLTASMSIFSTDNVLVGSGNMTGNYMGAYVSARLTEGQPRPDSGTVSIRFNGEGGSFQNDVTFRLMEEAYIALAKPHLSVLVGSGDKFRLPVQFVDFAEIPSEAGFDGESLPIELGCDEAGNCYIEVTDNTPLPERITAFYEEVPFIISARDGDELIEARFSVLKCYEGVLLDFGNGEGEIMAYKDPEGQMHSTDVSFQVGRFDRQRGEMEIIAPGELSIEYKDEQGIYDLIGMVHELDLNRPAPDAAIYSLSTKKPLPSMENVPGIIKYSTEIDGVRHENQAPITLIPDAITYDQDWDREYANCVRIIETYMPEPFRTRKLLELENNKDRLGLQDLQAYRQSCWVIARNLIFQEKEDYLQESYWKEQKIAELQTVAHIGDMAFTSVAASMGGPITIFLLENIKDTILDVFEQLTLKGSVFTWEALQEIAYNRFKHLMGSVTSFVDITRKPNTKVILAYLAYFYTYRAFYRWYFDRDLDGHRLGVTPALTSAVRDVFDWAALETLKTIMRNQLTLEMGSRDLTYQRSGEHKVIQDAVVLGLDAADAVAGGVDEMLERAMAILTDAIANIGSLVGA